MPYPVIDFPKIKSPFIRHHIDGHYFCTPEIEPGYEWVFTEPGVKAVDKLHGTNICLVFDDGKLLHVDNRSTRILESPEIRLGLPTSLSRVLQGVLVAFERGWLPKDIKGRIYGELVGPTINGNLHRLDKHHFVPFDYLKASHHWKSWARGDYPKDYQTIKDWFKELPSLFAKKIAKQDVLAEGLVFHHLDGRMAKLRRDMFYA